MEERIIIAGSGGQGVQTLGFLLAEVGMSDKKRVTWLPSYGAEKRGGFSFCHVVISDQEIYSPYIESPDTLLLFDQRALNTYKDYVLNHTLVIENSSLIKEDTVVNGKKVSIPATDIANSILFTQAANTVMAGAYFALKTIFHVENALKVMRAVLVKKSKQIFEKNEKALYQGFNFIKENYQYV
ncbi:MAG: 2-oxoacid:acceptor oxidoreductase family protein [Spirochaetales bacterium]|nr:2-oxoacid:acceptor oxidoreductase family protein [Spirochaetales bacterium]